MKSARKSIKGEGYRLFRRGTARFVMGIGPIQDSFRCRRVAGRLYCAVRVNGRETRRSCHTHSVTAAHEFARLLRQHLARATAAAGAGGGIVNQSKFSYEY
ncbi:MAG: hypothetical protein LBK60_09095 [Verrucomicrobiales bacterium]|jgi:hypothetical protein|nr:hypothetical protein [Verrucomicrobiales bacterium]